MQQQSEGEKKKGAKVRSPLAQWESDSRRSTSVCVLMLKQKFPAFCTERCFIKLLLGLDIRHDWLFFFYFQTVSYKSEGF